MKNKIIIAFMLMASLTQAQVTVDWSSFPGGVSIATDTLNNVYTANWDYNPAGDITLTKTKRCRKTYYGKLHTIIMDNTKHEVATWVETDNAGDVLVSGTIRSGFSSPVNAASVINEVRLIRNITVARSLRKFI
jgi:hypothetical protein